MNEINKIKEKAEALYNTRKAIAKIEEEARKHTTELKMQKDTLQTELIALMNEVELSSIKVSSGESYSKASRNGIGIINPEQALF